MAQGKDFVAPSSSQVAEHETNGRVSELEIAGLHPGQDTMRKAYHRFGKDRVSNELSQSGSVVWLDVCNHQMLTVSFDTNRIIRGVTIQHTPGVTDADCDLRSYSRNARSRMGATGHGLLFGDRCDRVRQLYGPRYSDDHSASSAQESNSFVYHFDRGSEGIHLTLEITCDPASKTVKTIQLTSPGPVNP
jgi:hypothetical protein